MFWDIANIIFSVVYFYTILTTIIFLLTENRNPVKSIAWILVLVFLPVVGFICYVLVGRKFRKRRIISKRSIRTLRKYEKTTRKDLSELSLTEQQNAIASLAMSNGDASFFEGNSIEIFVKADELYEKILEDIRNARSHINLEYYIFCPDNIGTKIMDALIAKAREGVEIRVVIDDVGSWKFKKKHIKKLTSEGIQVKSFLEVGLPFISSRVNYRNHRKILVIDGKIGYTGGINVADRYVNGLKWGGWRDTHVRMEGSVVFGLQRTFFEDWYFVTQTLIEDGSYYPDPGVVGNRMLQTVVSGPDMEWESIMQLFVKAFSMAKKRIYIETPYFLPPESLQTALQSAALSGVDVRLILPRKSDAIITLYSTRSYLDDMFRAGVKIYFYEKGFIHSKVTIVDDDIAMVGSANMDFRSFEQNFELNTVIYSKEVVDELLAIFQKDICDSSIVDEEKWSLRPYGRRILESLARLCSPLL